MRTASSAVHGLLALEERPERSAGNMRRPDGDPEALFDTVVRAQLDMARKMQKIQRERPEG